MARIIAQGRLATIATHHHDPRATRHRDPDEEVVEGPTLILSDGEPWHFRSADTAAEIDGRRVLMVAPGTPYRARHERARPEDRSITITFAPDVRMPQGADEPSMETPFETRWQPRSARIEALRLALVRAALTHDGHAAGAACAMRATVDELALDLLAAVDAEAAVAPVVTDRGDPRERVVEGAAWLRRNLEGEIDLLALAQATHTSPYHLSRLFRRHLGLPPIAYLRSLRLERAAQLLADERASVTDVCYGVGFGSLSHFVTAFRRTYGVSPGAFRRGRRAVAPARH